MSKRKLQDLNIDNYVNWYKDLTIKVSMLEIWEDRKIRFSLASFGLHSRYVLNNENIGSNDLSTIFFDEAKKIDEKIGKIKRWLIEIKGTPIFYIPTLKDWQYFDFLNSFDILVEQLTEKINSSALPEIEILQNELQRKNEEDISLLHYFEMGTPFLYPAAKSFEFDFANEVSNINYCKYLADRIKELETTKEAKATHVLQWELGQKELSELIKALHLKKAFGNITETKVREFFEKIFNVNFKSRHSININELQDKKPTEYFTHQLKTEIHNHISSLKPTK